MTFEEWEEVDINLDGKAVVADWKAEREKLIDALEWIMPMAKEYAVEHPVGRNQTIATHACAILAELEEKK